MRGAYWIGGGVGDVGRRFSGTGGAAAARKQDVVILTRCGLGQKIYQST